MVTEPFSITEAPRKNRDEFRPRTCPTPTTSRASTRIEYRGRPWGRLDGHSVRLTHLLIPCDPTENARPSLSATHQPAHNPIGQALGHRPGGRGAGGHPGGTFPHGADGTRRHARVPGRQKSSILQRLRRNSAVPRRREQAEGTKSENSARLISKAYRDPRASFQR